jgi:hypothetical protein
MHRDKMSELSSAIQNGKVEDWGAFAKDYENSGGNMQMFNAFVARNMQFKDEGKLDKFRQDMQKDTELKRSTDRMKLGATKEPYWMDKYMAGSEGQ